MGAAHADVCRFGRSVGDLLYFRDLLFLRSKRLADVALGRFGDCLLCDVLGAGGLGGAFRNFSCPHTRDGNGAFHFLSLGGLFLADLYQQGANIVVADLNEAVGASGTFWLYAGICLAGFLFIRAKLPETKGKTLEELEKELTK